MMESTPKKKDGTLTRESYPKEDFQDEEEKQEPLVIGKRFHLIKRFKKEREKVGIFFGRDQYQECDVALKLVRSIFIFEQFGGKRQYSKTQNSFYQRERQVLLKMRDKNGKTPTSLIVQAFPNSSTVVTMKPTTYFTSQ